MTDPPNPFNPRPMTSRPVNLTEPMNTDTDDKKGGPLGQPDLQRGEPQPAGAGDEGGLGFLGDQRGTTVEALQELEVNTEPGQPIAPVKKDRADQSGLRSVDAPPGS